MRESVCVCVCVCERERERVRMREGEKRIGSPAVRVISYLKLFWSKRPEKDSGEKITTQVRIRNGLDVGVGDDDSSVSLRPKAAVRIPVVRNQVRKYDQGQ